MAGKFLFRSIDEQENCMEVITQNFRDALTQSDRSYEPRIVKCISLAQQPSDKYICVSAFDNEVLIFKHSPSNPHYVEYPAFVHKHLMLANLRWVSAQHGGSAMYSLPLSCFPDLRGVPSAAENILSDAMSFFNFGFCQEYIHCRIESHCLITDPAILSHCAYRAGSEHRK
ncbi:MAG: hypothetical protein LUC19_02760 [Oscillospiraceae bacterium]|nr:hypothetical protein [Oscillospiraceae bacterium]